MELTRWRPKYRQELQPDHDWGGGGGVPKWAQTLRRFGKEVATALWTRMTHIFLFQVHQKKKENKVTYNLELYLNVDKPRRLYTEKESKR
jgi:hypothetical protein